MTIIEELENRFLQLRRQFNAGLLSPEQFQAEVDRLQFQDAQGHYWTIGSRSGRWYYHDGNQWVQAEPPRTAWANLCPRCGRPIEIGFISCDSCGYQVSDAPSSAFVLATAQPPDQMKRARREVPTWIWVGCAALIVAGLMITAVVIGAGSMALLNPEWETPTPTRPAVIPLPEIATQTPTTQPPIVLLPSPTALLPSNPAELIANGDELVLQTELKEAITSYQRATEIDTTNALAYARWARALYMHYWSRIDEALAKALVATQLDPNSVEAFAQLARCYTWNDQAEEAIETAKTAIELDPDHVDAYAFLAEAYLKADRLDEALNEAQIALQLSDGSAEAHRSMAHILLAQGQEKEALTEFEKAAELEPELAPRRYELGLQYQRMGQHNKAIVEFEKAIELYPDFAWAYSRLGRSYYDGRRDETKALPNLEKAIELDPEFALAYYNMGYLYSQLDQCDEAIPMFQKALTLDPELQMAQAGITQCELAMAMPTPVPTPTSLPATATPVPEPTAIPEPTKAPLEAPPAGPTEAPPQAPPAEPTEVPSEEPSQPQLTGRIAYPVFYADQGTYDINIWNADGSGQIFFIGQASQPDFSPDGTHIAFRSWKSDTRGVFAMGGPSGIDYHRITSQSFFEDARPCWSPEGGRIVFFSRRESDRRPRLYISEGENERSLGVLGTNPDWLPDGRIVYQGCANEVCGIIVINPDGSNPIAITSDGRDAAPSPSSDGSKIAFMSQREGDWEIYVVDVDGSELKRVTDNSAQDGLPTWSPDGNAIAFASDRDGRWAIWAMNSDGSNQRQLFSIEGSGINGIVKGKPDWESRGWLEEHISWTP